MTFRRFDFRLNNFRSDRITNGFNKPLVFYVMKTKKEMKMPNNFLEQNDVYYHLLEVRYHRVRQNMEIRVSHV